MYIYDTERFIKEALDAETTDKIKDISKSAPKGNASNKEMQALCSQLCDVLKDTPYSIDYIDALNEISKDKKLHKILSYAFNKNNPDKEIEIEMDNNAAVGVKDCIITQNAIDINKSLPYGLSNKFGSLDVYFSKKPIQFHKALPIILYEDGGRYYIMDGHHRWSQTIMFNPDAEMAAIVIKETKKQTDEFGPISMLKEFQTVIALDRADKGKGLEAMTASDVKSENLLNSDCDIDAIKKTIENVWNKGEWWTSDSEKETDKSFDDMEKLCCEKINGYLGMEEDDEKYIKNEGDLAKYLYGNKKNYVEKLRLGNRDMMPPRDVMPQADTDESPENRLWPRRLKRASQEL